jgi:hypothetical protein
MIQQTIGINRRPAIGHASIQVRLIEPQLTIATAPEYEGENLLLL